MRFEIDRARAGFSALQRAEIAEIRSYCRASSRTARVSVLFNEPKLLKSVVGVFAFFALFGFSALQRAEIAEISITVIDKHLALRVSVLFNEPKLLK